MAITPKVNTFVNGHVADAGEVNQNFDNLYNDYNGNITDANFATSGISTYGKVQGAALSVLSGINSGAGAIPAVNLSALMPVGTVYSNVSVSTNPGTIFGFGTWVALEGVVIAGYKSGDANFGTAGATIGAATVNAQHTHAVVVPKDGWGAGGTSQPAGSLNITVGGSDTSVTADRTLTSAAGGSVTQSTLQPTLVAYCWQRTA